jgi:hypothetical protein
MVLSFISAGTFLTFGVENLKIVMIGTEKFETAAVKLFGEGLVCYCLTD